VSFALASNSFYQLKFYPLLDFQKESFQVQLVRITSSITISIIIINITISISN